MGANAMYGTGARYFRTAHRVMVKDLGSMVSWELSR